MLKGDKDVMDIRFKEFDKKSTDYKKFKALYNKAFPVYERYPIFILSWRSKSENIKFYNIYDEDLWIGFNYLVIGENIVMVQYLAVDTIVRSKGYGGKIIEKIYDIYTGKTIALGIERPDENSKDNENRIRRKRFYLNNGFIDSGYYIKQKPVPFELLIHGNYFSMDEFLKLFEALFGKFLYRIICPLMKNRIIKED